MFHRFKALAVACALALSAQSASSLVYHYDYEGNPFECPPWAYVSCYDVEGDRFTGGFLIDDEKLPGGALANSRLFVEFLLGDSYSDDPYGWLSFEFESEGATYTGSRVLEASPQGPWRNQTHGDKLFDFLGLWSPLDNRGSIFRETLFNVVVEYTTSSFELMFDGDNQITYWRGNGGLQGGSQDFTLSSISGDNRANSAHADPGTWNLKYVGPSPVPLPAGGLLLGAALVGLGVRSRLKRKA